MPNVTGTKRELLERLDQLTRGIDTAPTGQLTTARIAADINVSRSLTSQYLNELVRDGLVIKVNTRPVVYLHRAVLSHCLQASIDKSEYSSMAELLECAGIHEKKDFEKAIGHNLSLASCIDQLKAAIGYPPNGLPILMSGEPGSGRALLSRLAFEYGRNSGALSQQAQYARFDCVRYADDIAVLRRMLLGTEKQDGVLNTVRGGIVYFENVESLDRRHRKTLLSLLDEYGRQRRGHEAQPARIILSFSGETEQISSVGCSVPISVAVPPLRERTADERTELVMHFLRAEGVRVFSEFSISRGALRALVRAAFPDNVDGLRACVVSCCSDAYVTHKDGELAIRTFNLPAAILSSFSACEGDDHLLSCRRNEHAAGSVSFEIRILEKVFACFERFNAGELSFGELLSEATESVREYQNHLNFESRTANVRALSYEQVINSVLETVGTAHDVNLTRKSSRLLAQCLTSQILGGNGMDLWKRDHAVGISRMASVLSSHLRTTAAVVNHVVAETRKALGIELDALGRLVLTLDINPAVSESRARTCVGIVCCHGYSTATSIADAANRILHAHVFDAIDMAYDQEVTDVIRPLGRILERYDYCQSLILLIDMGSLAELRLELAKNVDMDIVVINNVSTGLAIEVGSAIQAGEDPTERLDEVASLCAPSYQVALRERVADVIVFCSESGKDAADKIRRLFAESLPADNDIALVVADYQDLVEHGTDGLALAPGSVRAIVGTMDPGMEGVPFFALEDILYEGPTERLDRVFLRSAGAREIGSFHRSLLKRLTLQNVIGSITILNPERLYTEVSRAVERLIVLSGESVAPAASIGLHVHLCCLVERLVTKTPIESHADPAGFERDHGPFIAAFLRSFADIANHYHVEVPVTEIAYVYDYINSKSVTRERPSKDSKGGVQQQDE